MSTNFAIYSDDDKSLRFYNRVAIPSEGAEYNGLSVTRVYTGFDTNVYAAESAVPWFKVKDDIQTVAFEDIIAPYSMACWFSTLTALVDFQARNLDTSNVQTCFKAFNECTALTELDLSLLDVSNVQDFTECFAGCTALETLTLGYWDTTSAVFVDRMFYGCESLNVIATKTGADWNTDTASSYDDMFTGCVSLPGYDEEADNDITCANISVYLTGEIVIKIEPASLMYTGSSLSDEFNISVWDGEELVKGTDYTVNFKNSNNVNITQLTSAGTYPVVVTGITFDGTLKSEVTITRALITDATIEGDTVYEYNPEHAITPTFKFYYGSERLSELIDYDIEGETTFTKVGVYTITATGTGNFCDSLDVTVTVLNTTRKYHQRNAGIQIGNYHSYNDFKAFLIAKGVAAPEKKTAFVEDIPFTDGMFDYSALYGRAFYTYRTATYVFRIYQDQEAVHTFLDWLYSINDEDIYDPDEPYWHLHGSIESVTLSDVSLGHYAELQAVFRCQPYWESSEETSVDLVKGKSYITNTGIAAPLYAKSNEDGVAVTLTINGLGQSFYSRARLLTDLPSGVTLIESTGNCTIYYSARKL